MVAKRSVGMALVLSIITCGLYSIYWFIKLTDEINYVSDNTGDTSGGIAFLLTLITCGIYAWFWYYKMGEKLDQASLSKGYPTQSKGVLYLVLGILGFGIVSYALMQDSLNKLA